MTVQSKSILIHENAHLHKVQLKIFEKNSNTLYTHLALSDYHQNELGGNLFKQKN